MTDPPELIGRSELVDAILGTIEPAPRGASAVAWIEGPGGIGKTSVVSEVVRRTRASGVRVLAFRGAAAESTFAYVGLRDLFVDLEDAELAAADEPQRIALTASLLRAPIERPVDAHAVAAATASVLQQLRVSGPVLVVIDDAQWIDAESSRAVSYAARRLRDPGVGFLVSTRPGAASALADLARDGIVTRHEVGGLSIGGVQRLLTERLGIALSRPRLTRLHAITQGNPFFALEIGRGLGPDGSGDLERIPEEIEDVVAARILALSPLALQVLGIAAIAPSPTLNKIFKAVGAHAVDGIHEAMDAELVVATSDAIDFVHPLFAAAVARRLSGAETRRLHRSLADVSDDPVERAVHVAAATIEPNTDVAEDLEAASGEAARRGAPEIAAALAEAAARLTPGESDEARSVRYAEASLVATRSGDRSRALDTAAQAIKLAPNDAVGAFGLVALAYAQFHFGDYEDADRTFADAVAAGEEPTQLEALVGRAAIAARTNIAAAIDPLDQMLRIATDHDSDDVRYAHQMKAAHEFAIGLPVDRDGVRSRSEGPATLRHITPLVSILMWGDELGDAQELIEGLLARIRRVGNVANEAQALRHSLEVAVRTGSVGASEALIEAMRALALFPGVARDVRLNLHALTAVVAARRDDPDAAQAELALARELTDGSAGGDLRIAHSAGYGAMVADDVDTALRELLRAEEIAHGYGLVHPGVVPYRADLVEVLLAAGLVDEAATHAQRLYDDGVRVGSVRGVGTGHRVAGLVASARGEHDEGLARLEAALGVLGPSPLRIEAARTLLAQGKSLRRMKRRGDARAALDQASAIFEDLGAAAWARHARAELGRISGRAAAPSAGLTRTEEEIATLVGEGLTNQEVASRLFVSVRTVESNLTRVYRKLGLKGRSELVQRTTRELR